ncbi:MAG: PAS domain-containing protein [Candidatus Bathyarchaeia archaeon]
MIENLSKETIETMLNALPVEISFVDHTDTLRYFNKNGDRIFPRPRSAIGRKVQNCHPQKSLHKVNQILEGFKAGTLDQARFWIDLRGRKVYIRYFPVRDERGRYIGALEATEDITDIKTIEGEKRLL